MALPKLENLEIVVLLGCKAISSTDKVVTSDDEADLSLGLLLPYIESLNLEKDELLSFRSLLLNITNGKYCEIIQSDLTSEILGPSFEKKYDSINEHRLSLAISKFLEQNDRFHSVYLRQCVLMFIGVTALNLFIQRNWTGDSACDENPNTFQVLSSYFSTEDDVYEWAVETMCGVPIYNMARNLELLVLAKTILCHFVSLPATSSWWKLRCIRVCQLVMLEISAQLHDEAKILLPDMSKVISVCNDSFKNEANIILNLEAFHFFLTFGNLAKAKEHLTTSQKLAGLEVEMTGFLGKRTRFQQVPHAQLVLKVNRESSSSDGAPPNPNVSDLPHDVALQDDTLLSKVMFLGIDDTDIHDLYPLEQAIILSLCQFYQKMSANDELLQEETMAYLDRILKQPQSWCIQLTSLFTRCKIEKHKLRKIERAMAQLQVLVDTSKSKTLASWKRLEMFFCTSTPPWWVLEKELAHILISLGAVKSALDVFLHLKLWEEVAMCYKSLQEPERAANILKQQLSIKETPVLWCLLGDVTADLECYGKAWTLSNGRYSRAQKSLGLWHFRKKDYNKSIPYFLKSTELNSLDLEVWFPLAYSAMETKDYDLAAKSYRHIVSLDPDSFEAWNNLSKVYVLTKQKERAWRTLQEALKCNYEEWRIWENHLIVSVDIGAFEDAIKSWHRLIDIKGKHVDDEILTIIITAVIKGISDINGNSASLLSDKALKLLGHITATDTNSARTWSLYGSLLDIQTESSDSTADVMDRVIQYHQKAFRSAMHKKGWETEINTCREAFGYGEKLIEAGVKLSRLSLDQENTKRTLQSIRLAVKSGISLASRYTAVSPQEELITLARTLEAKLDDLSDIVNI